MKRFVIYGNLAWIVEAKDYDEAFDIFDNMSLEEMNNAMVVGSDSYEIALDEEETND